MKQIIVLLIFMTTTVVALGQNSTGGERWKLAVYATGNASETIKIITQNKVATALTNSGNYQLIERSSEFLKAITQEQKYQQSGEVDDKQITTLGIKYGAKYVCVVNIMQVTEANYIQIAMRLIDVELATSERAGEAESANYQGPGDLDGVVSNAVKQMLVSGSSTPTSSSGNRPAVQQQSAVRQLTAVHKNGDVYNPDGIELVFVEGTNTGVLGMESFYIGKYEVTQAQWRAVMGNNPSHFSGDNNPVERVSWNDVQEFINKLNQMTGRTYSLPTEAQWEYAARGGINKENYEYAGSNSIDDVAWYKKNSKRRTHVVGQKSPNSIGIYDMSGNIWEWCQDCYNDRCSHRVVRGGNWLIDASYCRVSHRFMNLPRNRLSYLGFRLALVQ